MTQGELEKLAIPMGRIFSDLEQQIMSDIVRRIKINGFSTATADWEMTRLQQLGASEKEIGNGYRRRSRLRKKNWGVFIRTRYTGSIQAFREPTGSKALNRFRLRTIFRCSS